MQRDVAIIGWSDGNHDERDSIAYKNQEQLFPSFGRGQVRTPCGRVVILYRKKPFDGLYRFLFESDMSLHWGEYPFHNSHAASLRGHGQLQLFMQGCHGKEDFQGLFNRLK